MPRPLASRQVAVPASLSVIIPVYRAHATLPAVLAALRPQIAGTTEVVAVDSSGDEHAAALERDHPWLRVVALPERALPGEARNIGAKLARGSQLAFLDGDAVPAPRWLECLQAGIGNGRTIAAAGAVNNGTPGDAVGTTSYLLEFSEFTPGRSGTPLHGASCNLLVDRAAFEQAGGFCEDVWPGEDTILTMPWGQTQRLAFASDAAVWHLNRTDFRELIRHQYRLGRSFAAVCDRVDVPYSRFSRWPFLAATPGLRLVALAVRMSGQRALARDFARVSPLLTLGVTAWTAGLAAERGIPQC